MLPKAALKWTTYYDVDALAGAGWANEDSGLLVGDEQLHEGCVAHSVLSGHNDLIELNVLWDRGRCLQLVSPELPPAWALKSKEEDQE